MMSLKVFQQSFEMLTALIAFLLYFFTSELFQIPITQLRFDLKK